MVQFFKASGSSKKGRKNNSSAAKGQPESLCIDVLDQHGKGIALSTHPITVVEGALPTETLNVQILSESKNVRNGKIISIQSPSPDRIQAICAVYEACGGCNLQTLSAEKGLAHKQDALVRYFKRALKIEDTVWQASVHADIDYSNAQSDIGYRRKVRFAVDARQKNSVKIGYRQSRSNKIIDVDTCPILLASLKDKIEVFLPLLKKLRCIQKVGHLECTLTTDGVILLINFSKSVSSDDLKALENLSEKTKIRLISRAKEGILGDFGKEFASLSVSDISGLNLDISVHDFIQVNPAVNRQMIEKAVLWLAPTATTRVHDFYCGVGNFSIPLAKQCSKLLGYEAVHTMVEQARHNADKNGAFNTEFTTINLSDQSALQTLDIASTDYVLLDPSREGAHELCEVLLKSKPARIVYVSCNSNTLVRDLQTLSAAYKVSALCALDMFPFTQHLEVMALLEAK